QVDGDAGDNRGTKRILAVVALQIGRARAKTQLGSGDGDDRRGSLVDQVDGDERLHDLLTVGADVLDRRGAGRAGDAAHRFDALQALGDGPGDELVPVLTGLDAHALVPLGGTI